MLVQPATEGNIIVTQNGGMQKRGGGSISALTLTGGVAKAILYDATASASGDVIWQLDSASGDAVSVSFPKPIPFANGIYLDMTPSGGAVKLCIALE